MSVAAVTREQPEGDIRVRRWHVLAPALGVTIVVLVVASVLLGEVNLSPSQAWRALTDAPGVPLLHDLAVDVRAPRALLALIAGACLGVAGALLQALTRNALASPELTGVTAGAVAAVVTWFAFGLPIPAGLVDWLRPIVATAGGLAAAGIVYLLSRRHGGVESTRMILMGVLVAGVLTAMTTLSLLFLGPRIEGIIDWIAGTLTGKSWSDLRLVTIYILPGMLLGFVAIGRANVLQLGDDVALGLGQRRERDRFLVLLVAVILTAGVVSVVGAIAFVGLMAPHLVRPWIGSDLRRLVPASALVGSVMLLVADLVARFFDVRWLLSAELDERVYSGYLPLGVYLTLFGVPFVLTLVWKKSR